VLELSDRMANGDKAQVIVDGVPVYTLRGKVDKGGMAKVYLAEANLEAIVNRINRNVPNEEKRQIVIDQLLVNPFCAIKICDFDAAQKENFKQRFFREIKMSLGLLHDNVISVFDAGEAKTGRLEYYFYSMEYIDQVPKPENGSDPKTYPRLEIPTIIIIGIEAAKGLGYLHRHEDLIVHRDVKPDNILVSKDLKTVKISDLGIAKWNKEETHQVTMTGAIIGTPKFMSPEQAKESKHIDYRTDIYSLGASLYYMLTGKDPFQGSSALHVMDKIKTGFEEGLKNGNFVLPRAQNPEIGLGLEAVILRAMAVNPEERYQTMEELGSDLNIVLQKPNVVPKRAQNYVQISVVSEEQKKIEVIDTGRNLAPVEKRKSPGRRARIITKPHAPVEEQPVEQKPFYKKPAVIGGIAAGAAALALAGIFAFSGPKLPDVNSYKIKAASVQELYNNGKYDEVLSAAPTIDSDLDSILSKFPEGKFPDARNFALMKSEINRLVQKSKDCKEYIGVQSAFDALFKELETNYDASKHTELDAKSSALVSLLDKADVKEKDAKRKEIFTRKDFAITLKNKALYTAAEKQFGDIEKIYNELKSADYNKAKIDSLEASLKTAEAALKPVDTKRVSIDELKQKVASMYKGIETLRLKDPAKKFGLVVQIYGEAENRIQSVIKQGDKRDLPLVYEKLKEAKATLEQVPEKTSADYKKLDKNISELEKTAGSLTELMPEIKLNFENEVDLAYFKGDAKLGAKELEISGKAEYSKPFSQNSVSYDATGKFSMSIGSDKFIFDKGTVYYGSITAPYKDKGTNFIEYVAGEGLYVNGTRVVDSKKKAEGKVVFEGNVKINYLTLW
jgi:serine/threonine protein kinase